MSFPRYERYKDSGVEWLGKVPEHWQVRRLRYSARLVTEKATQQTNPLALENIESWTGRLLPSETKFEGDGTSFRRGDLLFGKLRPYLAKAYLAESEGEAVGDFHVMRPSPFISGRFLFHQLINRDSIALLDGSTFGSKMPRVGWDFMANMVLATPPIAEQARIADFIAQETAKINALIEEQRRLIDLLKEKRQAVISHAVSPRHFSEPVASHAAVGPSRNRLRHHVLRIEQGWSPIAADRDPEQGEWAVLKLSAVKRGEFDGTKAKALPPEAAIAHNLEVRHGDFLITRANTPDLVGDSCYVYEPPQRLIFSDLIYRLSLNESTMSGEFLNLVLQSAIGRGQAKRDARGSSQSMVKLGHDHILNWLVPAPSLAVQQKIVTYVRAQLEELNCAAEVCNISISLLEERRSALISAVVSGKIDVRKYTTEEAA